MAGKISLLVAKELTANEVWPYVLPTRQLQPIRTLVQEPLL